MKARGVAAGKARQRSADSNRVETTARRPVQAQQPAYKPLSVATSASGRPSRASRQAGRAEGEQAQRRSAAPSAGGSRTRGDGGEAADQRHASASSRAGASSREGSEPFSGKGQEQPLSRVLDALRTGAASVAGAVGGAFASAAEALSARVPALERFGARAVAIALGVLAALVVLLLVAAVRGCAAAPAAEQPAQEAAGEQQEQQEEQVQTVGTGVNPDEPADLAWRDSDFAVDPAKASWTNKDNGRKVVYLTIDDGPSALTEQFLDMLDEYGAKATFFVTGQNPEYYGLIREAYNRGHTIGLHSMTHDYQQVYASEDAYYADLDAIGRVVEEQIGYVPCFIRFPGGSSNGRAEEYSKGLMAKLVDGVQQRGYQYYDWSLSSGDGENRTAKELIAQSTTSDAGEGGADPTSDTNIVLLCHDSATKQSTLEALPKIIEYYQSKGYTFEAIDRNTWACHHGIYVPEDEASDQSADTDAQSADAGEQSADGEAYAEAEAYVDEAAYYDESAEYADGADEGDGYYEEYYDDGSSADYAEDSGYDEQT